MGASHGAMTGLQLSAGKLKCQKKEALAIAKRRLMRDKLTVIVKSRKVNNVSS
jgi:hypothetical protein